MILVLFDDQTVEVFDSPEEVARSVEGLTVGDGVVNMYDERGQRYVAEWIHPNRHGRLFGLIRWSDSGVYRLRPDGQPDPRLVHDLVGRAVGLGRRGKFQSIEELTAALQENGIENEPVDGLPQSNAAFQAKVAKSKASPRKPFTPGAD